MKKFYHYLKDSTHELKLVTWPTQERLVQLTVITVVFVLSAALFLGIVDFSFTKAYQWLLSLNK
jgi:preprotein translocase SecE subunit